MTCGHNTIHQPRRPHTQIPRQALSAEPTLNKREQATRPEHPGKPPDPTLLVPKMVHDKGSPHQISLTNPLDNAVTNGIPQNPHHLNSTHFTPIGCEPCALGCAFEGGVDVVGCGFE
ncbi:hypothetical protein ACFQ1S_04530 [Kibdelosporangium lantanae]|uniref:Uncharacterized protein n=1 Tax=Kibdelosporangium lantanae TaxID=1497396 RepID=A0ABW3M2X8_9PSEU